VRTCGLVTDLRALGPQEHLCWAFQDATSYRTQVWHFLHAGLDAGQRVFLITAEGGLPVEPALTPTAIGAALSSGAARLVPVESIYRPGTDPARPVDFYRSAVQQALADGFTGLRVATETNGELMRGTAIDVVARLEGVIDRALAPQPFTALCGYDAASIDPAVLRRLSSVHPASNVPDAPFRLFATPGRGGARTALLGEVDSFSQQLFAAALRDWFAPGDEVIIDASRLRFADHHALMALDEFGRERAVTAVLTAGAVVLRRLAELLRLENLRVEVRG
jgi:MEDS: MEthanogen/methylotroph, DcmR Sensory domain